MAEHVPQPAEHAPQVVERVLQAVLAQDLSPALGPTSVVVALGPARARACSRGRDRALAPEPARGLEVVLQRYPRGDPGLDLVRASDPVRELVPEQAWRHARQLAPSVPVAREFLSSRRACPGWDKGRPVRDYRIRGPVSRIAPPIAHSRFRIARRA